MKDRELQLIYKSEKLQGKINVAMTALDNINVELFNLNIDEDNLDNIAETISEIRENVRDLKDFLHLAV